MTSRKESILDLIDARRKVWERIITMFSCGAPSRIEKIAMRVALDRLLGIKLATGNPDWSPYKDDSVDLRQEYEYIRSLLDRMPTLVTGQERD